MNKDLKKALATLRLRHRKDPLAQCSDNKPFNWGHFSCNRCDAIAKAEGYYKRPLGLAESAKELCKS